MKFPDPTRGFQQQDEDTLLAMLVWGEARSEPAEGRLAVAYVPITRLALRVQTPRWGPNLAKTILKRSAFSCFNPLDPNRDKLLRPVDHEGLGTWAACWQSANEALKGQSENPAPGATHYVVRRLWSRPAADPSRPQWYEQPMIEDGETRLIAVIGSHIFARTN